MRCLVLKDFKLIDHGFLHNNPVQFSIEEIGSKNINNLDCIVLDTSYNISKTEYNLQKDMEMILFDTELINLLFNNNLIQHCEVSDD